MSPPTPGAAAPPEGVTSLLAGLEPAQREAVMADDPVVCVLAGAGAGKTRVLTLRVARRVEDGSAHPSHVLVCTFSRRAADELRSRLWSLGAGDGVAAGTFHRTALRLIARLRAERGAAPPVVGDRRSVLGAVLGEGRRRSGTARRPSTRSPGTRSPSTRRDRAAGGRELGRLDTEIGWAKSRMVAPADYEAAARSAGRRSGMAPERVAELYERYEAARRARGVLDLDDLLWHCGDLLAGDPAFAQAVRWWHRHLFVDEAQDMNEAQYRLLRLLVGTQPDLFAVGDPNQSVYGWNGADPGLLRRVTEEFAGTRVVRLATNHRCTPQVVSAASAVLDLDGPAGPVSTRPDGPLPQVARLATDTEEAAWVARQVWLAHRPGRRWSSIAVLARTNAQLTALAAALEHERVPHRLAGAELGPASDVSGSNPRRPAAGDRSGDDVAGGRSGDDVAGGRSGDDAGAGTSDAFDDAGTDDSAMDDAGARADADDAAPDVQAGNPEDRVVLSTFHRAKGLQWPVVFVVGLNDGTVPLVSARTRAARAEERRLLYVALTRAEDQLVCTGATHAGGPTSEPGDPRQPCPWLEPLQRRVEELRQAEATAAPEQVAEHLARIRQLLPAGGAVAGAAREDP